MKNLDKALNSSLIGAIITIEGGVVAAGDSMTQYTTTITTEGGAVVAGLATIQVGIFGLGGVVVGGSSPLNSSTTIESSGGAESGGSGLATKITSETATGGALIVQPLHGTGFTHRMSLTIPAASIQANLTMMAGVRVPAVFSDCVVTTSAGSVLNSQVRETTLSDTCLFFRADLSATTDNEFFIYFNHEA